VLELIIIAIYSFGGSWADYLLPFWYLENPFLVIFGWILLHSSLIWIIIAQLQMANSWRIGIDTKNKTQLITKGLFSISRNPIFLGILVADLGLSLVIPNAFTLLITVLSFAAIQTQVRLEETFLQQSHGEDYAVYFNRVRRWVGSKNSNV
jgi:protein-S-isoprenylcysteine O-methyltransferase Ste14